MKKDCKCDKCTSACKQKPGWFKPGEVEKVAEYLDIPLKELFDTKLMVDWWEAEEDIFMLSPAVKGGNIGGEFPSNPQGECIFFKDGLCGIHKVKPFECREYMHGEGKSDGITSHEKVKEVWDTEENQNQIKELLGRTPITQEYSLIDSMNW